MPVRFRDLPLQAKFLVCLAVFFLLPLVTVAVLINLQAYGTIRTNVRQTQMQVLKQTKPMLEALVRDTELISLTLLSDEKMQAMIRYHLGEEPAVPSGLTQEQRAYDFQVSFQPLMASRPYIQTICVSRDGGVVFQYGDRVTAEDTRFDAVARERGGRPFWTGVYTVANRTAQTPAVPVVSLIRTVNDLYAMRALATERISIPETHLRSLYANIQQGMAGGVFMVDGEGRMLSAASAAGLGQAPADESYVPSLLPAAEGMFGTTRAGEPVTVFHYRIDRTGWHVVQWVPDRVLDRQNGLLNLVLAAGIGLCVLFGGLFLLVQNRSINQPIRQIVTQMEKVRAGDFDVSLALPARDEIGNLGRQFQEMVDRIRTLIDTVYKSRIKEREAELMAMEAQIRPHFLYNTLDSIRWMAVRNRDYAVGEQIEALSDLFRHVLNQGRDTTTIREEVRHLENYLLIQNNRYGDRITFRVETDETLLDCACPKLLLQPLVENAIGHGLERKVGPGCVTVTLWREAGSIRFRVADDGVGTDGAAITARMAGPGDDVFALKNIQERIRLRYGEPYGITFTSRPGEGTVVEGLLPGEGAPS